MSDKTLDFDITREASHLSPERLLDMAEAADVVLDCFRLLEKAGANVVGQCLAHQGTFFELDHYPKGDVYDSEFHSQYYYHAHRPESGEHGHFHTFLRAAGMPKGMAPVPYQGKAKRPTGKDALTHFVAISMDRPGRPVALFTTNRWVTDETFYRAQDVIAMLDRFKMDHTYPCLAVNRWITAMLRLFRPQIEALLIERDRAVAVWAEGHPGVDVYEDRGLEVTSIMAIDVERQVAAVRAAAGRRRSA
jgi:hypothetical protein